VPSSLRNMPVWGMLNRLAECGKGTAQEGLFLCRVTVYSPEGRLQMFVAWYFFSQPFLESSLSHSVRCLAERSCPNVWVSVSPPCPSVKAPIVPRLSSLPNFSRRKDLAACWHNSSRSSAMSMRCSLGRLEWERRMRVSIALLFINWHPLMLRCTRLARRGDCVDKAS